MGNTVKTPMSANEEESIQIQNSTVIITNVQYVKQEHRHHPRLARQSYMSKCFPVPLPLEPAEMSRVGLV